jgi:diguanylate cyclase (GGDEF)-like protein
MLMTPTVFFLWASPMLSDYHLIGFSGALVNLYSLLPFLVIASLSIFTLTIKEFFFITLPIIMITLWSLFPETSEEIPNSVMLIWLFLLLVLSSFFSSISQMRYMISQVTRASYDALTNAMTRRAGIEALALFFRMATLQNIPLTLLFIDLDHFKQLNDEYGHDAGDRALVDAVCMLKDCTRKGDNIIRWGGEEFLVLLPHADYKDTRRVIGRIIDNGLGKRPDGTQLTASMGLAETQRDKVKNWNDLVNLADKRMYQAKQLGRARCVGCQEESLILSG